MDDIKLKIENLGYKFDPSNYTKIGCEAIGMKEYKVTIHHLKNLACAIYEFKEETGAEEYFKKWSEEYKKVSESKYVEIPNIGYKKYEQNVLKNGYYCVIIKRENLVLFATEFWKRKDNLEALLEKINYLR